MQGRYGKKGVLPYLLKVGVADVLWLTRAIE